MSTITGYNDSPPADDGTKTAANKVTYASITTNLTDPIKDFVEANLPIKGQSNAAPTVTDDVNKGYEPLSTIIDTAAGVAYICTDNTAGAAVWQGIGVSDVVSDTTPQLGGNLDKNGNLSNLPVGMGNIIVPHENLIAKYVSATTVDIDADKLLLKDSNGYVYQAEDVNVTVDITSSGVNGLDQGSEAGSTWYGKWIISNGSTEAGILSSCQERTTDGTTTGKLEDSSESFDTDGTAIGDIVLNTTDNTRTLVTAIDDANTLSVRDDIFASGETYIIIKSPKFPSGYTYKGLVGFVYNNSGSDFEEFHQVNNSVAGSTKTVLSGANPNGSWSTTSLSDIIPPLCAKMGGYWAGYSATSGNPGTAYLRSLAAPSTNNLGYLRHDSRNASTSSEYVPYMIDIMKTQLLDYNAASGDRISVFCTKWEY